MKYIQNFDSKLYKPLVQLLWPNLASYSIGLDPCTKKKHKKSVNPKIPLIGLNPNFEIGLKLEFGFPSHMNITSKTHIYYG